MTNMITARGIEAIAVKRAVITDADKVRYRVYRSEDDFVAVIAENALLAMKAAGIEEPFRIVRDFPSDGVTMEAERIAKVEKEERVSLAVKPKEGVSGRHIAEMVPMSEVKDTGFVSLKLRDLQKGNVPTGGVLRHDQVNPVAAEKPAPKPAPVAEVAPVVVAETVPMEQQVAQAAEAAPVAQAPAVPAKPVVEEQLSPDDVAKLLEG